MVALVVGRDCGKQLSILWWWQHDRLKKDRVVATSTQTDSHAICVDDHGQQKSHSPHMQILAALLICQIAAYSTALGVDGDMQGRGYWLSALLAPFGALSRWLLSLRFNKKPSPLPTFPVGTFLVRIELTELGESHVSSVRRALCTTFRSS